MLVIEGDWNAKVGPDAYQNRAGTVRRFGIGETKTEDGDSQSSQRASDSSLPTLSIPKSSSTATWHAPNEQVHNQRDFILKPQRFKFSINKANARSFL